MIGKTISHYTILEKLGEGGMGVVYKAHDTKLDRVVALKFLPPYLTCDPREKERFYHEARAASALLHPNAAVVFEIDEKDAQVFIAMEYVEGRTLKQVIGEETLSIGKALDIAIQVCDGLAAAHEKEIVHRDIKSENIMVTPKGQAKITDFGLAKVKGATRLTREGSTVGTALYMSPEQVRGEEVDHRSDLFSFGVVLYEMFTGRLPFSGEHQAALFYSIVNDEPQPIAWFNEKAGPEIERIVAKALEKDRDQRYQHADEMLVDLKRERKKLEYAKTGQLPASARAKKRPPRKWLLYGGVAAAVLIAVAGALYLHALKRHPRAVLNPDMTFRVLPSPFPQVGRPGLSQDGNWAAFPAADANGRYAIYLMSTTSGESRRVTSDSILYAHSADISPDGSQIVYDGIDASGTRPIVAIVSAVGGPSRTVVERGWAPRWRPDGQRIGYVSDEESGSRSRKAEFRTVRPNGSDDRRELIDSASVNAARFSWSPDGRSICWIRSVSPQSVDLTIYELSSGRARQVTFDKKDIDNVCWAPNDQIIYSSNRTGNYNLWMVPASGGSPTRITKGIGPDYSTGISRDGSKLLYRQSQTLNHIWIAGIDGTKPRQITFDDAYLWGITFSADGKEILFGNAAPGGAGAGTCIFSIDRDGSNRRRLTSGEEWVGRPLPSPDGRWIIYDRDPIGAPGESTMVCLIDAKNPVAPTSIAKGGAMGWADDTTFVTWNGATMSTWLNTITGGEPKRFFEDSTDAVPLQGGKYIGYVDHRTKREGVWICSAPGMQDRSLPAPRKIAPLPAWGDFDRSGEYYYWVRNAGELRRIAIPSGKEEIIRGVFPGLTATDSEWNISDDGKEVVYTDASVSIKLVLIENPFK